MTSFSATATRTADGCCELVVQGEVDVEVADQVAVLAVDNLRDPAVRSLVIDLSAVTFLDSTGISALIKARNSALAEDKALSLRSVPERVARLLHLTGLDGIFTVS
jgi:anti-sigma B factor antagonist